MPASSLDLLWIVYVWEDDKASHVCIDNLNFSSCHSKKETGYIYFLFWQSIHNIKLPMVNIRSVLFQR